MPKIGNRLLMSQNLLFCFNRRQNSKTNYFLCNQRLNNIDNRPYLGIELESNLKWEPHYKITSKASRMLLMLRRVLKHADTKTQKTVYSSLVRPILEYGCIVWDHFLKNNIKTFEKKA